MTEEVTAPRSRGLDGGGLVVALVFAALFALAEVTPVSNLVALPAFYDYYGIGDATPWVLLVLGVTIPVALYVVAVLVGRARPLFARALVLTVALAATFALEFGVMALAAALQPALG